MKKILSTLLTVAITAAVAITGTLAYLTWEEGSVDVATTGNIKIQQIELQRAEGVAHNTTAKEGDLVPYVQGQKLYPAYPETADAYTAEATDLFYWGDYVTAEGAGNGLWDSENLNGAIDKFVFVKNTGSADAYYRTLIALECPEGMAFSQGSDKHFMMNINGNHRFAWDEVGYTTIDGTRYLLMEALYKEVLAPGEISRPSLLQVVMTDKVTNDDVAKLGDTYDILVYSQACQVENMPDAETALNAAFYDVTVDVHPWGNAPVVKPIVVSDAKEMQTAFKTAGAPKAGNTSIYIAEDIDASQLDWEPVYVSGYNGAGVVTIDGQGNTITGLTEPLFKGGFAGKSGIIIRNLTIADSEIKSANTQGAGAFVECVDSMETIILENCHLLNSTVDAPDARTGGLIGWTSGYSNQNDGPVKTYVTVSDCSVIGCTITGTSVGGINGHAGASDWTYTTIENCTVLNNELISYDDGEWRVGAVVGTANIGEVTINNVVAGSNVMTQAQASSQRADGLSELVGRFVPGSTGKLNINGAVKAATANTTAELSAALNDNAKVVVLGDATYTIPSAIAGKEVTLVGSENTVIDFKNAYNVSGATLTFENIKFQGKNENVMNNFGLHNASGDVVYKNCTFDGAVTNEHYANVDYIDCTFTGTGYITTYSVPSADFVNCTFDKADSRALLVYSHGNHPINVTVKNCTFKAAEKGYTMAPAWTAAVEVDTTNITTAGTTVTIENCTADSNYNGIVRDKSAASAVKAVITVDGVAQ